MQLIGLTQIDEVKPGDNLALLLIEAFNSQGVKVEQGDILVIAQKIVSKAEDCYVKLNTVNTTDKAIELAEEVDKDPRLVQLILNESKTVVRKRKGVIIVEHNLGYVHANAGIDRSNLPEADDGAERVLLLPSNPDKSAKKLMQALSRQFNCDLGVIINDSAGRAWREGTQGFAIGVAGFNPLIDMIGRTDRDGREMQVTQVAVADELAAAASYIMGQADEGIPAVLIKHAHPVLGDFSSDVLIRPSQYDLFR